MRTAEDKARIARTAMDVASPRLVHASSGVK
jgi:hypothetical protein